MTWVYVLRGEAGRLYVGSTENLEQRLRQHHAGLVHTTKRMGRLELVGVRTFATIED
jgi:predicted GIY-YIG superfamily endonuclease